MAGESVARRAAGGLSPERAQHLASRGLLYLLALVAAVLFMTPFFWTVSSSLKAMTEIYAYPPQALPAVPQWRNYARVFEMVPFATFARNSIIVTLSAMTGQVLSASLVAFGFARFRFPGRDALFVLVLSTMLLPWEVTIVPLFLIFRAVGLLNSLWPLIIPAWFGGGAFFIFLLRQFFLTIPREFDEAARMDGASSLAIYWRIILPLSRPALATVAIFSFLNHWNEFIGPLIYINSSEWFTMPIGLRYFQNTPFSGEDPKEALLMAASIIMATPCVILFFAAQKYFVQGIVMSGIKG
jgi:ABC-type glycerol-3-phosphate transport system permease component